ncbi:MAG: sulfate adenylyltransferase subunit CysN [Plesiomonas sp.]|uniref:sulfate adenylyltransferase subunit CysN n=1 Tax=Plesiomonas sp. TaxID=2486279 RepID=UPI003F3D0D91
MNNYIAQQIAEQGVEAYLLAQQHKGLLRFLTCGSVDDGKSTLIGRLLHDTRQIYEDQLSSLHADSRRIGTAGEKLDLALLVDGLQAEREQGITIDVAYRYFSTDKRKFIIADTPGHEQYTRNMATGASTCDVAILLIDARKGMLSQTRRHSFIANLLGIRHFVVAVNKMDLVGYSAEIFAQIKQDYLAFADRLNPELQITILPLSALDGDNVVQRTENLNWYQGPALLQVLEEIDVVQSRTEQALRFPVQYVSRPDRDFRGYAGTLASGTVAVGQKLKVLPSGLETHVSRIVTFDGDLPVAVPGQAITLVLADEIDISRGDLLIAAGDPLQTTSRILADVVWMTEQPLQVGKTYDIKLAGKKTQARISAILHQTDVNSHAQHETDALPLNGIGRVEIEFTEPLALDTYRQSAECGSFIFIDRLSNVTVGAGLIHQRLSTRDTTDAAQQAGAASSQPYSAFERELNALIRKQYPHWGARDISTDIFDDTGLSYE